MNYVKITNNLFISIKVDKFNQKILTIRNQNANKGDKVVLKSIPGGIHDNIVNNILNLSSLSKKEYSKAIKITEKFNTVNEKGSFDEYSEESFKIPGVSDLLLIESFSNQIESEIIKSLTDEEQDILNHKVIEPTIKDSEFYKYDKLKATTLFNKFPPDFIEKLHKVAISHVIPYYNTGTVVWYEKLKETCLECECPELLHEYEELTWEESDDFDNLLALKLLEFNTKDGK